MNRFVPILVAALLLAVSGCAAPSTNQDEPAAESLAAPGPVPTWAELASATYRGIDDQGVVTLSDGRWEGEPFIEGGASVPAVWLTENFYLTGDLDGDGAEEAVAHLTSGSGGSGSFGFLVVLGRRGDEIVQKGLAEVGDRVQLRGARIENGSIVLDVLQAGPDDGLCCPTQLASRVFAMQDGALVETATEVIGSATLATLQGKEWVLRRWSSTEAAPSEPRVTLTIDGDRVSGSSGCNTYQGTVGSGEIATDLTIGPLMTTRKACPPPAMDIEQRYTRALQGAQSWGFQLGQLTITHQEGDSWGTLFFEAREPDSGE